MAPPADTPSVNSAASTAEPALLALLRLYLRHALPDLSAALREHDLSLPQLGALQHLRASGEQSVSGLARHLNLSLTATSHLVERLVQKELVTRSEDARDRRQKRVGLAGAGAALLSGLDARSAATLEALFEAVPAEARAALDRALGAVLAELEGTRQRPCDSMRP